MADAKGKRSGMGGADSTDADWAVELLEAYTLDEVPKGWHTVAELVAKSGLPENPIKSRLNRMERDGKIHKKALRIDIGGLRRMVNHYGESE